MLSEVCDDLEQWLQALPLNQTIDIDGESVYLKVQPKGAELGILLLRNYTGIQLAEALRTGFQSALEFDAGLGVNVEEQMLVLTRWLPDLGAWPDAAEALESILNQTSMWRAALTPVEADQDDIIKRSEERIRHSLSGGNR